MLLSDLESEGYFSVTDVGASRKITCLEPMYQHSTVIWRQNAGQLATTSELVACQMAETSLRKR